MTRRRSIGLAAITVVVLGMIVTALLSGAVTARGAEEATPGKPSDGDRRVERELDSLVDAWREGGGTYGYPFWQKAQERWRAGTISASVLREYTTGYRDSLKLGCELMEGVDVRTEVAKDVRGLLVTSCRARLEALRAQQRQLDGVVERGTAAAGELDAEELADLDKEVAEQANAVAERLQESFRATREAMDITQAELDARGLDRVREDAFI